MVFGKEQKLNVKLQYKSSVYAVDIPASATFRELRYEAAQRIGIPADAFVLKFRGREKSNSEGLLTAGLKNGACVLAQETAVHEAIRGASFAGLEQQHQGAAKPSPAHYQQSPPLRQQQATARAHSSRGGSSHSAAAAAGSHLDPRAQSFTPPAQGTHPRVYVAATNGQRSGREDEHSLRQNDVHGAWYPQSQTSFTAGGQAGGLVHPPRSPEAGVPANWEGQFTSSDGPSRAGPRMSQQRQHHADYIAESIEADRRQKRQMFEQHQAMQQQQAEAHDHRQQQQQQQQAGGRQPHSSQEARTPDRVLRPRPELSLEEQLLAKVAVQEREMAAFAQQVDDYTGSNGDCAHREGALKQKLILTELLTRVMLALDGVRPPDGGETPMAVRAARKAAIIRAQALINRVEATSAANAASVR